MFGIGYFKGQPADFIVKYSAGRIVKQGQGLAFSYLRYKTQIAAVPTSSRDESFVFNEITSNFQAVTIQGQFTYRINNPGQAAKQLNFVIDPRRREYISDDPQRLPARITNIVQTEARGEIQRRSLEETLRQAEGIAADALRRINDARLLDTLGVELLSIHILSARPTPEVAKALEAEYRETLLRKADEAIYARRAAAVEEERKIKTNELNAQIFLEEQRQSFIDLQGKNAEQEAGFRGKALEVEAQYRTKALAAELSTYRDFDPRSLLALAIKELGENAEKVGNLTITSEVLAALLDSRQSS